MEILQQTLEYIDDLDIKDGDRLKICNKLLELSRNPIVMAPKKKPYQSPKLSKLNNEWEELKFYNWDKVYNYKEIKSNAVRQPLLEFCKFFDNGIGDLELIKQIDKRKLDRYFHYNDFVFISRCDYESRNEQIKVIEMINILRTNFSPTGLYLRKHFMIRCLDFRISNCYEPSKSSVSRTYSMLYSRYFRK